MKMKKFQKLITVILTVSLMLTLWIPSVFAADIYLRTKDGNIDGELGADNFWNTTITLSSVTGLGGKDSNDASAKITSTTAGKRSDKMYIDNILDKSMVDYADGKYKIVVAINIYPVKNLSQLDFGGKDNNAISGVIYQSDMILNQWNRVTWVYDGSVGDYGTAYIYVNGVVKSTLGFTSTTKGYLTNAIKIIPVPGADAEYYADDFTVYAHPKADGELNLLPPALTGDLVVDNTVIAGNTLSRVKAAAPASGVTVKAFRNDAEIIEDNTELVVGDKIVLVDEARSYAYYTVANEPEYIHLDDNSYSLEKGTASYEVDGTAGKSASDKVTMVTNRGDNTDYDTYLYKSISADEDWPMVIECEFMPGEDVSSFYPATKQNRRLTEENINIGGIVKANRWNKIKTVLDYTVATSTTYVNGVQVDTKQFDNPSETLHTFTKGEIRFVVNWNDQNTDDNTEEKFYIDNFKISQTRTAKLDTPITIAGSDAYLYNGGEIAFYDDTTVSQAVAALNLGDCVTLSAYNSESDMTALGNDAVLTEGNLLVAVSDENVWGYYAVRDNMLTITGAGYVNSSTFTGGALSIKAASVSEGAALLVAEYNGSKGLETVHMQKAAPGANELTVNMTPLAATKEIKVMIWKDFSTIKPYVKAMNLTYQAPVE